MDVQYKQSWALCVYNIKKIIIMNEYNDESASHFVLLKQITYDLNELYLNRK